MICPTDRKRSLGVEALNYHWSFFVHVIGHKLSEPTGPYLNLLTKVRYLNSPPCGCISCPH